MKLCRKREAIRSGAILLAENTEEEKNITGSGILPGELEPHIGHLGTGDKHCKDKSTQLI